MIELTVSVASALIAASLAIFQFLLPNALALVLTGLLSEEQSAVTWSVASRFFLSSDWPTFLRSESVSTSGVPGKISLVTWTKPIGFLLIAVAAVITPLGLYDDITPVGQIENVEFVYVPDSSIIGAGTPLRSSRGFNFSRACSGYLCPGDPDLGNVTIVEMYNKTTNTTKPYSYRWMSSSISPTLIDLYQGDSDDRSPSLSGYFDIQARQWGLWKDPRIAGNGSLLEAQYKYLSNIMMDGRIELFEGLIVDTKNGGIGFRNHSVPDAQSLYGVEWEEEILWMQPESACVNTNLTTVYTGSPTAIISTSGDLVDNGGFCNLQKINPYYTAPNTTRAYVFENAHADPFLYERAYFLAWGNNAITMEYLNITDPRTNRSRISSTFGQKFKVNGTFTKVNLGLSYDDYFTISRTNSMVTMPYAATWNSTAKNYTTNSNPIIKNPHNITADQLDNHINYCKGALKGDHVNISTLDITVGFIAGPAMLINRTDPNNASSDTTWERACYACAAATKVSVKTVRFRFNSTRFARLSNLEVLEIKDKIYRTEAEKPVWGLETPWWDPTTTWNLSLIEPLWGMLKKPVSSSKNISTLQSEHFYIPASYGTVAPGWSSDVFYRSYTPGTTGPSAAWTVFGKLYYSSMTDPYMLSDQRQRNFYKDMMTNTTGTANLLNLMWTDQAANIMVGTRGLHTPRYQSLQSQRLRKRNDGTDFASLQTAHYPVQLLARRIHYRWVYGIPALICVALIGIVMVFAFVSFVCGLGTVARLRWFMFNSTSGRVFAAHKHPDEGGDKSVPTDVWLKNVGNRSIVVSGYEADYEMYRIRSMDKRPQPYVRVAQREETE